MPILTDSIVKLFAFAVGVCALTWLLQDYLVFLPRLAGPPARMPERARPLEITSADGVRIRGWMLPARATGLTGDKAPVVIYFGGNAEDVSWTLSDPHWPDDWAVAAFNYRGYGASEGRPGEKSLLDDALVIHDFMARLDDVDRDRIVVFGRSLGTAVAAFVAGRRPVAGAVLVSPFDSMVALGRHHYPYLPVSLLLRHRFDSVAAAREASAPMQAIVADADTVVPLVRSRALYDAWAGPKQWEVVPGTDHNNLAEPPVFWECVAAFLRRVQAR